jgi:large subunit ribosomal protein L15
MIQLHNLKPPAGSKFEKKRVARGTGGKGGKTAGRGTKGQGARDNIKPGFEGGQLPITQRLPKLKGFRNPFRVSYSVVNVRNLNEIEENDITPEVLRQKGLAHKHGLIKLLGEGEITRPVNVSVHAVSHHAKSLIEAAGGSVTVLEHRYSNKRPPKRGNALTNR